MAAVRGEESSPAAEKGAQARRKVKKRRRTEPEPAPESGPGPQPGKGTEPGPATEPEPKQAPERVSAQERPRPPPVAAVDDFGRMGLDTRTLRAAQRLGFHKPTPVQAATIPAALSGRDVLAAAPAGSGKTAAYLLPLCEQLLRSESTGREASPGPLGLILVPSRELAHQVSRVLRDLLKHIGSEIPLVLLAAKKNKSGTIAGRSAGGVLVGTPAGVVEAADGVDLSHVAFLVVDEADLMLSYGYEDETREALSHVPRTAQGMLVSATLGDDVELLRKLVLRRPQIVKISALNSGGTDPDEDGGEDGKPVVHHVAQVKSDVDKYLVVYAMLRLKVLTGKSLFFVNQIDRAFRLKLFLDQFTIRSAVLNSELPLKSRVHCVDQFNAGVFDILIATDELLLGVGSNGKSGDAKETENPRPKRPRPRKDREFGVMRGIDFRNVATVINFDLARSVTCYTHRSGRTGRGGASGTVLSLTASDEETHGVGDIARTLDVPVTPLAFRMDQVEAFRYRVEDGLRAVSRVAVREARLTEVRREMLNSEKLKGYFAENPVDLQALRHDRALTTKVQPHLSHIPGYLLPPALRSNAEQVMASTKKKKRKRGSGGKKRAPRRGEDPLHSFSAPDGEARD